ncbi:hypothetical protein [Rhizobium leguminosarum]|uniref:hypothetical protein n=1 Tax=Rhizobium leguminosarum TaxID=384 RepID=UPI0028AE1198|nr:hypothetical protein [Rhizobium leguminosarum]
MSGSDQLSYGVARTTAVQLASETYPGVLNVAFTRGFISSQAFVDNYVDHGPVRTLLPPDSKSGLSFVPTHPDTKSALAWMGFKAYRELLEVLDGCRL